MKSLFVIIGAFLFAAASFGEAVEEMWHYDAAGGVACLPLVTDHNNDGQLSVLVVEHDTGMVRVLDHDGQFMFRLPRPNALSGSVVSAGRPGVFAFQEVTGRIHLLDYRGYHVYNAPVDSRPARSAGMCMADLDGDGQAEVLHARRDGVVTAFDQELVPRWRAYLGAPIVAPPAAAPVFLDSAAVYLRTADGALSAFDGRGKPLWRRSITRACTAPIPYATAPLIVQLAGKRPTVLITGADGRLVAVDAIDGSVTWAVQVGKSAAGAPAIADVNGNGTREIVVVDARGSIAVIGPDGTILRRSSLPSGDYVPRPLVADADGDGEMEIIIARRPWEIVVASLDGLVATTASLRGGASEGLVLHDIDRDGRLDLLAATDCGRVHCFSTHAKTGWTHPYANASLNGTVLPITPQPRPPVQRVRRRVHVRSVTLGENTVGGTFATAYVRIKEEKHARHARLTLRREEAILGSAIQPLTGSGLSVPFLTAERNTLLLDVTLLDENGAVVAASTGVPILSDPVELIDMPPIDPFLKALDAHAARFSLPTRWWPADANGKRFRFITNVTPDEWTARGIHAKTFIDNASPHPFGLTADAAQPCAPAVFAATRAQARARGLPWTLQIDNTFAGAITDTAYAPPDTGPQWQPPATATGFDCGHSPSLEFRLAMTGYLAGASALARPPQHAGLGLLHEKTPGQFTLGPFGGIASHIDAFAALYPQPGAPYTPVALVIDTTNPETPLAENELVRHVFAYDGVTGFERGYLTNGPYGDLFDLLRTSFAQDVLNDYPVLWPVGNVKVSENAEPGTLPLTALTEYVNRGGILVLNASQAAQCPRDFTGVKLKDRTEPATQTQTVLGATPPAEAPYCYHPMSVPRGAHTLAWTGTGDPLLAWRPYGEGIVIVAATDRWVDVTGRLLPIAPTLLGVIIGAFQPIRVTGQVEMLLNQTDRGWLVGLVNNNGILKAPTLPSIIDPKQAQDCFIQFNRDVPLRFTGHLGKFRWSNRANALHTRIPPGGVAIVEVILKQD